MVKDMNKDQELTYKQLIKALESTEEYKQWQESLFAIIGYATGEDSDDKDLIRMLMAEHLIASIQLQDGLVTAKINASKAWHEDWELDNAGQ